MEKKRMIIIAIILFLLVGFGTFVFANPNEEETKYKDDSNNTKVVDEEKDENESNSLSDSIVNEDNNIVQDIPGVLSNLQVSPNYILNDNNDSNNEVGTTFVDDTYKKALEAVINAENTLKQNDVNNANDLVNLVVNDSQKQELLDRLTNVQEIIDVSALVEQLKKLTNEATDKNLLDDARNFRVVNDVVSRVYMLNNNKKKEELKSILDELAIILDDTTAPIISGIKDGDITNNIVKLSVNEEVSKILLNDQEVKLDDIKNISVDGVYTILVIDRAFNESSKLTFTIDTTKPEVLSLEQKYEDKENGRIKVTIKTSEEIFGEDVNDYGWRKIADNTYVNYFYKTKDVVINAYDKAGNKLNYKFTVDKTAPKIKLNGDSEIVLEAGIDTYKELGATVTDNVDETINNLQPEKINYSINDEFMGEVDTVNTKVPGTYKVVYTYTDKTGNVGVDINREDHKYVIRIVKVVDTTAPKIKLNGDSKITINAGVDTYKELGATVTDNVDETITNLQPEKIHYSVNGKFMGTVDMVDPNKPGTYKLQYTYTDKAGNKGVDINREDHEYVIRTVTVSDTTAPVPTRIGAFNLTNFNSGNIYYVKENEMIRVMVYFNEKLAVEPTVTINNKTYKATFREASSNQTNFAYYADIKITDDLNLNYGEISFKVSDYADASGNVGEEKTNNDINDQTYKGIVFISENTKLISNDSELVEAIKNQKDNQTLLFVKEGTYNASPNGNDGYILDDSNKINYLVGPFALPIYADNFTIKKADGVGEVVLTSSYVPSDSQGGNWNNQNFITISGSNVTIEGISLKANKNDYYGTCNKIIELVDNGKNLNLKDINIIPLSNEDGTTYGGSIYYNVRDAGKSSIENVNMDSWISAPNLNKGTLTINNLTQDFSNSQYAGYEINGKYNWNPGVVGNYEGIKVSNFTIKVGKNINLSKQVFNNELRNNTTIELVDDIVIDETININKNVTINGNNHTISGTKLTGNNIIGFLINDGTTVMKKLVFTDFDENINAPYGSVIKIDDGHDNARFEANSIKIYNFVREAISIKSGSFKLTNSYIDCKPEESRPKSLTKGLQIGFGNSNVSGIIRNTTIENSSSNYEEWSSSAIEIYNNADVKISDSKINNVVNGIWVDHYWAGSSYYPNLSGDTKVSIENTEINATEYATVLYSRENAVSKYFVSINNSKLSGKVDIVDKTDNDSLTIDGKEIK